MSFTYNDDGIRTSKTVNGVKHTYKLNGSQIVSEQWEDKLLVYLYDASGAPIGMMYRTTNYAVGDFDVFWYEKNLQGDIVAVYNSDGVACVTYKYDAWGNCTESDILTSGTNVYAASNPFRYRGYYYDADLGMYYLQSRYYDSKICRFINADGYASTGQGLTGNNMFAYCGNNPVNRVDPTGNIWRLVLAVVLVAGVVLLTGCTEQKPTQEQIDQAKAAANNATAQDIYSRTKTTPNSNDEDLMNYDSLYTVIDIEEYKGLSSDKKKIREYTDLLADSIETEYASYLGGNSINRDQLYGEIMLHIIGWDCGIFTDRTKEIELNIYADGSVKDGRWFIDIPSKILGGGYSD